MERADWARPPILSRDGEGRLGRDGLAADPGPRWRGPTGPAEMDWPPILGRDGEGRLGRDGLVADPWAVGVAPKHYIYTYIHMHMHILFHFISRSFSSFCAFFFFFFFCFSMASLRYLYQLVQQKNRMRHMAFALVSLLKCPVGTSSMHPPIHQANSIKIYTTAKEETATPPKLPDECLWCRGSGCEVNNCRICPYPTMRYAVNFYRQESRFACQICETPNNPRFFVGPNALNNHYKRVHSELYENGVECACGAFFSTKDEVSQHKDAHDRRRCQQFKDAHDRHRSFPLVEGETSDQRRLRIKSDIRWSKKAHYVLLDHGY